MARFAPVTLMIAGAVLLFSASQAAINAQGIKHYTDLGICMEDPSAPACLVDEWTPKQLAAIPLHGAALVNPEEDTMGMQLAFGMICLLLGFALHAMIVVREGESERKVPVKSAPKRRKPARKSRSPKNVIWIERRFRF